jgi:glutamate racemase
LIHALAPRCADPIGVFDSGIGGLSILKALMVEIPNEHFVYVADNRFAPYGERDEALVQARALAITDHLRTKHRIKALVVACNTATALAIGKLRQLHANRPGLLLVGVEPALKPASFHTRTAHVGVLATRATLQSEKFLSLKTSLETDTRFNLIACDGLADAIEQQNTSQIKDLCRFYINGLRPMGTLPGQIDTVVLGCTHYPFVTTHLQASASTDLLWIESGAPVARQVRRLLADHGLLKVRSTPRLTLECSAHIDRLERAAQHWLGVSAPATLI